MSTASPAASPVLGDHITRPAATKFLALVAFAMKNSVIRQAPEGPWHLSSNPQLQDCVSVPDPSGDGDLQIGKGIAKRPLRAMLAADPENLAEIAEMMSMAAEVEVPEPLLQHLLNLGVTWNRTMQLHVDEEWSPDASDDTVSETSDDKASEQDADEPEPDTDQEPQEAEEAVGDQAGSAALDSPDASETPETDEDVADSRDGWGSEESSLAGREDDTRSDDEATSGRHRSPTAVDDTAGW